MMGARSRTPRSISPTHRTQPSRTITGADPLLVPRGEAFADPSASCIDRVDGVLRVVLDSKKPDITSLGDTTLHYKCTDAAGNEAKISRVVTIVDKTKPRLTLNGLAQVKYE